ncbi:MAG TPA: ABC transporter permease [Streptosporangiaceae bacterium]|jgi:D-xylose transport system permease protein
MARADVTIPRRAGAAGLAPGEGGAVSVIAGLVVIGVIFQSLNRHFLSPVNLTDLLVQGAVFMLLGMSEVFALLLGDIDLSIGFVSGIGGVLTAELLIGSRDWPWWAAVITALLVTTAIGALQGTLIARLRLPSFVVTLAGLLACQGVMIWILGSVGTLPISDNVINDLASGCLTPAASWLLMAAIVAAFAVVTIRRDAERRSGGAAGPPASRTAAKVAAAAATGVAIVAVCDTNRGVLSPVRGVPWVVLIVLGVLFAWSFLLNRTRFGRDVHAIGSNAEAARRAGVSLAAIRTVSFALAGLTAGVGGIVYASQLRSVSSGTDGATLVLYAVAAAVIGGTSLFGGRGKPLDGVLGGIVIAAIYNGIYLLGMSAAAQDLIFALVLLAAVSADVLARRGQASRRA